MAGRCLIEEGTLPVLARRSLTAAAVLALAMPIASRPAIAQGVERSGKEVVQAVCAGCHATGANGAPKIGDQKAWSKRASQGLTSLTRHALEGIRKMPSHGGNPGLTDLEIGRAVAYMVNQSGGRWVEPATAKDLAVERSGEQVVKSQCVKCHEGGLRGAPKIGDREAWIPRMKQGLDSLVRSAIRGHGGMPPRGGQANLTDSEIQAAVLYMFNPTVKPAPGAAKGAGTPPTADPNHKTVGGIDFFLGFMPAEGLRAFPRDSVERTMHGGIPSGPGYYHVNVSLLDAKTQAPINDANVEIRIEQPGLNSAWKTLDPMAVGAASYGNYVKLQKKASYLITVRVQAPGSTRTVEAKFDQRVE
ncbi:MAG: cytochrome c5 family protein [Verrucomicrobia bacterium]|nr:MAG: cytochrome c5 family protein [Verrucomicrobiota bacterium]